MYTYPSKDQWIDLSNRYGFEDIDNILKDLSTSLLNNNDPVKHLEIDSWMRHLKNKIFNVQKSYFYMMFYYNMGIPDQE